MVPVVHGYALTPPVSDATLQQCTWEMTISILPSLQEQTGPATMAYTTALTSLQQEFAAQRHDQAAQVAWAK
jgi:hypothetical protein